MGFLIGPGVNRGTSYVLTVQSKSSEITGKSDESEPEKHCGICMLLLHRRSKEDISVALAAADIVQTVIGL